MTLLGRQKNWAEETKGEYTVKSAYKLFMDNILDSTGLYVDGHLEFEGSSLLTRSRLQRKGIECPSTCFLCNAGIENVSHLCWEELGLANSVSSLVMRCQSTTDLIFEALSMLEQNQKEIFAAATWSLWKARNDK